MTTVILDASFLSLVVINMHRFKIAMLKLKAFFFQKRTVNGRFPSFGRPTGSRMPAAKPPAECGGTGFGPSAGLACPSTHQPY